MKFKHYIFNLTSFGAVGLLFYLLAIGFNYLLIDRMHYPATPSAFGVMVVLFILKYYVYLYTKTITPNFWRYTLSNLAVTLASTWAIAYLVNHSEFSGAAATALALIAFMAIRYMILWQLKVIRRPE